MTARRELSAFRDGALAVVLFFAACAIVSDPHPANLEESSMPHPLTDSRPDVSRWHRHTDQPPADTLAIILIQPEGGEPVALAELYRWDAEAGHWSGAASHLKIRHAVFFWSAVQPTPPIPADTWQRDEEATASLLLLIGIDVDGESVAAWEDHQVREAEDWAAAVHLRAGDNAVRVPPMPMFLREFQGAAS